MDNKHFHRRKTLEIELLIVGLVVVSGHILGAFGNWYDNYSFFDNIVHFTAGFWSVLVLLAFFPPLKEVRIRTLLLAAGFFALLVGSAWEIFEFTIENLYLVDFQGPPPDTLLDLIIDTLGGLLAALYIRLYN